MNDSKRTEINEHSSLEEILQEINRPYDGTLPKEALREAQKRSQEITPYLMDLIRQGIRSYESIRTEDRDGPLLSLCLLTEFRVKEALPLILEGMTLPGQAPYDLFGPDTVTEYLARVLAALADDRPEVLDELILNRNIDYIIRWCAASTYLLLVRDGVLSREEAVQRLRTALQTIIQNEEDPTLIAGLVSELSHYGSPEAAPELLSAFDQGRVNTMIIHRENVLQDVEKGDEGFKARLAQAPPSGIRNTVEELSDWGGYQGTPLVREEEEISEEWDEDWDPGIVTIPKSDLDLLRPTGTIRNEQPKVGRNDPCPCGSGKKSKKCCGKS